MSLANGAHVTIGGMEYALDEGYIEETGRRCYVHGGRSIFAEKFDIPGYSGGRNLRQDRLLWYTTNFNGEGQVVLDGSDPDSYSRFYRSEGLDLRTPGEGRLNKSIVTQSVTVSAAAASTDEGSAFTDITGTSTSSGTDRRLNVVNDKIASPTNFAPGATTCTATFYLYREPFSDYATTVEGNDMIPEGGDQTTTGTDRVLRLNSAARTASLSGTTTLTERVELYLYTTAEKVNQTQYRARVVNVTTDTVVASKTGRLGDSSAPTTPTVVLNFVPRSGHSYRVFIQNISTSEASRRVLIDKVVYGTEIGPNTAEIEVYNNTTAATVDTKIVGVASTAAGAFVASITWPAAAATNYRFRVTRSYGNQRVYVDKVTFQALANAVYSFDCVEFGASGKVWLAASTAAADARLFVYDFTNNEWDTTVTLNDAVATTGAVVRALCHSDAREYAVLSNDEVYTGTSAGVDDRYAHFAADARDLVGGAVVQNRLALLAEDTLGAVIYSVPLDDTSTNPWVLNTPSVGIQTDPVNVGIKTPDTNLRARMCSSPTGARYFINFSDGTAKVFQSDLSGSNIATTELADLGHGVKATCISYEAGITFIGGLYYGLPGTDATTTDVDKLARAALWAIDQNGVVQRIGFFRRDDPAAGYPVEMEPFQQDLYILQSGIDKDGNQKGYVWRYSLVTGGLFCEYELPVATAANQRSIAVLPGYIFGVYSGEIFTSGTVGTYRQSSAEDGNSLTTSIYDFDLPAVAKSLTQVTVLTDTMPSATQVALEYQIDQDGTWTSLGQATSGKRTQFPLSDVTFTTLQLRATLSSSDGVSTPKLRAIVAEAQSAEEEEYFDLVLRCEDDDSYDHPAGLHRTGNDRAQNLIDLWRSGTPTTFVDGYASGVEGVADDTYLVRVGDFRDERNALGEGRVVATLKVIR